MKLINKVKRIVKDYTNKPDIEIWNENKIVLKGGDSQARQDVEDYFYNKNKNIIIQNDYTKKYITL